MIVSVIFSTLLRMQAGKHEHVACAHCNLVCLAWAALTMKCSHLVGRAHTILHGLVWIAWLAK